MLRRLELRSPAHQSVTAAAAAAVIIIVLVIRLSVIIIVFFIRLSVTIMVMHSWKSDCASENQRILFPNFLEEFFSPISPLYICS